MSGVGVYDMRFPKNQWKIVLEKEKKEKKSNSAAPQEVLSKEVHTPLICKLYCEFP